jgi:outer membrane protein assembly factor BamB
MKRFFVIWGVVLVVLVAVTTQSSAESSYTGFCVKTKKGTVRLVVDSSNCTTSETFVPLTTGPQGPQGPPGVGLNLLQIALLRWYGANTSGHSFPAGSPVGVAFDGANIWVSNFNSNTVTKLQTSDGANLGNFPVGTAPVGVAFDGANIWVTNKSDNDVTKLRASDGANLGNFPVGTAPQQVAFDGENVWVANSGSNDVTKLRASDGTNLGSFPVGTGPIGVAFDGANIWVGNNTSNSVSKL